MKDYTRAFPRLVSALLLTLTLFCSLVDAQSNPLSGSFGFLLNRYPVDASGGLGFILSLDMVATDGGQGLQLVMTNCSGGCDPAGAVWSGVARAAYNGSVNGSYGFQLNSNPLPSGFLGVMSFDGAGNAAITITNVGAQEGSPPPVGSATFTGTYSVNPDGSGTVTIPNPSGNGLTFATVATDGGSGLLLVLTGGPPGSNVSSGTARLQKRGCDAS